MLVGATAVAEMREVTGVLVPSGEVSRNKIPVASATAIYAGDSIDTHSGSEASLALEGGSRVILGERTEVTIARESVGYTVQLFRGQVVVVSDARRPVTVISDGVVTRPKKAGGAYSVHLEGGRFEVMAERGSATAANAETSLEIPEGNLLRAPVVAPASTSGKREAIVALVAAAVTAAGLAVALTRPQKKCQPVSPSGFTCTN
jgi:ferric-dicitrate binding protein FerR (iron transport regulator)